MYKRNRKSLTVALLAAAAGLALLLSGCGGIAKPAQAGEQKKAAVKTAAPAAKPAGTPVTVKIGETDVAHMYMHLSQTSVPAGPVSFTVVNEGVKKHEFVVLQTDTPAGAFKIVSFEGESDRIDEDADGTNVGETGDMEPGSTKILTITLKPGHYALVCNLAGHYRMGMMADFQVS